MLVLLPLLLVAFWVRVHFLFAEIFYSDEFISMLAARAVAAHGLPILPSGLLYDQGLPLSLLSGALIAVAGFREVIARWPTLLIGMLTVAVYYTVARRMADSRLAGLFAAALIALDPLAAVWNGRARGHSLAHLMVLLSLATVWLGVFGRPRRGVRLAGLAAIVLAIMSHNVAALIVAPIAVLVVAGAWLIRSPWPRGLREPGLWQEALAAVVAAGLIFALFSVGQIGSTVSLQDPYAAAPPPLGIEFLRGFFLPGLEWSRFDDLIGALINPTTIWLLPFMALSLVLTLTRVLRRRSTSADRALLFLVLFVALLILQQGALLTRSWQRPYLIYVTAWPAFLLVGAFSLSRVLQGCISLPGAAYRRAAFHSRRFVHGRVRRVWKPALQGLLPTNLKCTLLKGVAGWISAATHAGVPSGKVHSNHATDRQMAAPMWPACLATAAGLALVAAMWGPAIWRLGVTERGTGDYNTAFEYVREHSQPDDRIMTVHPSAAYLYTGRCDYYANQVSAKVLEDENEEAPLVDRYTGSPLVDTVDRLNQVLAAGAPVWFVADTSRLERRYEPFFAQQLFGQLDLVHTTGGVLVMRSRPFPLPLPETPAAPLDGNFAGVVRLEGYTLSGPTPDQSLLLALQWRLLADNPLAIGSAKVFVQLRDRAGATIAQADHYVYQGRLTIKAWQRLRELDEPLRDAAWLRVDGPVPADRGPYRIYVGLYNPETMERVPLQPDASGENAVVIDLAW